jgi:hypothetical protein
VEIAGPAKEVINDIIINLRVRLNFLREHEERCAPCKQHTREFVGLEQEVEALNIIFHTPRIKR